jgi:hypothetical protein
VRRRGVGLLLLAAAACAGAALPGAGRPPSPALALTIPAFLPRSSARSLEVTLRNVSGGAVVVLEPEPSDVRLTAAQGLAGVPCTNAELASGERERRIVIPPGGRVTVTVDVEARCAVAGADRFRLLVSYYQPGGALLGPASVDVAPSPAAALVPPPVPPSGASPRPDEPNPEQRAEAPPRVETGPAAAVPGSAPTAQPLHPYTFPAPGVVASYQACIDRELARRGLNVFGDPPGTQYTGGGDEPPAVRAGLPRRQYAVERVPGLQASCASLF